MVWTNENFFTVDGPVAAQNTAPTHLHHLNVVKADSIVFGKPYDVPGSISYVGDPPHSLVLVTYGGFERFGLFRSTKPGSDVVLRHASQGKASKAPTPLVGTINHKFGNGRLDHVVEEREGIVNQGRGIGHALP